MTVEMDWPKTYADWDVILDKFLAGKMSLRMVKELDRKHRNLQLTKMGLSNECK